MLRFSCPYCGQMKDETELSSGGQAHLVRQGPGSSDQDFEGYLFLRENPKGVHFERWRCASGCGKWFHAARCTITNEVFGTYRAQTKEPPSEIIEAIEKRRQNWRKGQER